MNILQKLLDRFTMFELVLYALYGLALWAVLGSVLGSLSFTVLELLLSFHALLGASVAAHLLLAWLFKAPANIQSSMITAVILFFLLQPSAEPLELAGLAAIGALGIVSKYVFVWRRVHLFNPVAVAAVIAGLTFIAAPTWWVGSRFMFFPVLLLGLLIVAKIRRLDLFLSVVISSTITIILYTLIRDFSVSTAVMRHFLSWPIVFFAAFMVTEPLSTPPRRYQRILYGSFIGIISSIPMSLGPVYMTPELALVLANIYSFALGLRGRIALTLLSVREVADRIFEFRFKAPSIPHFLPGQYVEWALPHANPDSRGIKRYMTISSSPTEDFIAMSAKIPDKPSSFKRTLTGMKPGDQLYVSQLVGDFTLPPHPEREHSVFIAGGIGVTPFRSMVKHAVDTKASLQATLFYCVNSPDELAFRDLFTEASSVDLSYIPVVTSNDVPSWDGEGGFIDADMIKRHISEPLRARYYLSGPPGMVNAYSSMLRRMGVPANRIETDFFPGYGT